MYITRVTQNTYPVHSKHCQCSCTCSDIVGLHCSCMLAFCIHSLVLRVCSACRQGVVYRNTIFQNPNSLISFPEEIAWRSKPFWHLFSASKQYITLTEDFQGVKPQTACFLTTCIHIHKHKLTQPKCITLHCCAYVHGRG